MANVELAWMLAISQRLPAPDAELREHVSAEVLGGPRGFNDTLASIGPLTATRTLDSTPNAVTAVADDRFLVNLHTNATGLIDGLRFRPYAPSPTSWSELDSRLRTLALRVTYAVSVVDKQCRPVHAVDADRKNPLGSAFKLYVLGALERGTTDWSTNLPIRDEWKSLPTGVLQDRPAGTNIPCNRQPARRPVTVD